MPGWDDDDPRDDGSPIAHGLALYPPPAVDRRLRRDLSDRGLPCPLRFHVTLKYSFVPIGDLKDRWAALARLVSRRPPLQLRSSGLFASAETFCHLLLISPDPSLMQLHEEVMALLDPCGPLVSPETVRFEGAGYLPHITLGYGACATDFEVHHAQLADYEPAIAFEVRAVDRVDSPLDSERRPRGRTVARSFRFGAGVPRTR